MVRRGPIAAPVARPAVVAPVPAPEPSAPSPVESQGDFWGIPEDENP
jgi:hypothetical protein